MRFSIGGNPSRTNLTLHFHEMSSASCSAVQITPRNGHHDDAPTNVFGISSGSARHRLALSVHEQPYRPDNSQWWSAHEPWNHAAEHHCVLSAREYGHQL